MSASFGERLLQEVHEEGLDELLHDLKVLHREHSGSTKASFGVPPIDEVLELFGPPSQPQHDLPKTREDIIVGPDSDTPAAENHEPAHLEVPVHPAFLSRPYTVLELSSTCSAAGKSQVLYYLAALAVLPSKFNRKSLNGFNSAVVFIDTDGRFDAERLRTVARGIVLDKLGNTVNSDTEKHGAVEAMIFASLQHIHVFRPQSSLALLATLQSLDAYLLDLSRHASSKRALQAIIIDSATAFLWQDKLQDEIARTENIGRSVAEIERKRLQRENFYLSDIYADLVASLKRLQSTYDCNVIYTATFFGGRSTEKPSMPYGSYNPLDTALQTPSFRSPLPSPWGLFPTLRLVLQRKVLRPFPPGVTVRGAERDAPMRQEVIMRGEFLGSVNGWGREDWPRRRLEELKRRGAQFTLNVGRNGVTLN
ncbi:hypothetical protein BDW72DRAFT_150078 [Aspergillus terricola var. indicus]